MSVKEIFEKVLEEDNEEDEEIKDLRDELKTINLNKVSNEGRDKIDLENDRKRKQEILKRIAELKNRKLKESLNEDKKAEAIKTLSMDDVAVRLAKKMTKEQAKSFLELIGMSKKDIERLSNPKQDNDETIPESIENLSIFQQHQKKIAIRTLKMSDAGALVIGGMNKVEARAFLKKIGYTDEKIKKIEED